MLELLPVSARCALLLYNFSVADPGFPRGGAPTLQKLHEIERIWTSGGTRPLSLPLRSATAS